jgi:hypothetical protein
MAKGKYNAVDRYEETYRKVAKNINGREKRPHEVQRKNFGSKGLADSGALKRTIAKRCLQRNTIKHRHI